MARAMASPEAKALHADGALFIGRIKSFTTVELEVVPSRRSPGPVRLHVARPLGIRRSRGRSRRDVARRAHDGPLDGAAIEAAGKADACESGAGFGLVRRKPTLRSAHRPRAASSGCRPRRAARPWRGPGRSRAAQDRPRGPPRPAACEARSSRSRRPRQRAQAAGSFRKTVPTRGRCGGIVAAAEQQRGRHLCAHRLDHSSPRGRLLQPTAKSRQRVGVHEVDLVEDHEVRVARAARSDGVADVAVGGARAHRLGVGQHDDAVDRERRQQADASAPPAPGSATPLVSIRMWSGARLAAGSVHAAPPSGRCRSCSRRSRRRCCSTSPSLRLDQVGVDRQLAEVVDQHREAPALGVAQQVVDQRGLAGAEIAADHRDRHGASAQRRVGGREHAAALHRAPDAHVLQRARRRSPAGRPRARRNRRACRIRSSRSRRRA